MGVIYTGVESVDKLYGVDFTGNLVPSIWLHRIVNKNGRPDMNAAMILSKILYWNRPKVEMNASDPEQVKLIKKFWADKPQLSYRQFEDEFNLSRDQCKRALDHLEDMGLIRRHFETITASDGRLLNNVMYIELFADRIIEISSAEPYDPGGIHPYRMCEESDEGYGSVSTEVGTDPKTNTKNTTKIATKIIDIDHTSFYQQERDKVMEQIEYKYLIRDRKNDKGMVDDIVDLITDINISGKKFHNVNGEPIPTDIVREHLSRIDIEVVKHVLDSIKSVTKPVTNVRGYLLTTLYNAPVTYQTGIEMQVTQDMYRKEAEAWQS